MRGLDHNNHETGKPYEHTTFNKKELNDLVTLLAEIVKAPAVVISLPGYEKVIIRERSNFQIEPGSRELSFCRHLVGKQESMEIADARFSDYLDHNFIAPGNPSIRFYYGVPLVASDGAPMGAICLFDEKPRRLSARHRRQITILSRQIIYFPEAEANSKIFHRQEIELERQKEKIISSERKLKAFFKSSVFCHMLIGKELEVVDFNRATASFVKRMFDKHTQPGQCVLDYIHPTYRQEFLTCLSRAFSGKKSNKEVLIRSENKEAAWWNIFLEPVKDEEGRVISVVYNATNINDQKQRIAEITTQNEILSNIAYIQSHDYRKPVASILGLMEVLRHGDEPLSEELQMMDEAVKDLDDKIRSVVNFTQTLSANQLV